VRLNLEISRDNLFPAILTRALLFLRIVIVHQKPSEEKDAEVASFGTLAAKSLKFL